METINSKTSAFRAIRVVGICLLAFVCAIPALADSTKWVPIIPNDPIVKKIYNWKNARLMLNDSKNRMWLTKVNTFGYLDTNDYFHDFSKLTGESWEVMTDWEPYPSTNFAFWRLQADRHGNIIAEHNYGVGWFDGKEWKCMLSDQYGYVKNLGARHYHPTKDHLCLNSYGWEVYRFPYDSTTNTYIPLAETKYSERFNDPNAMIFPYYNEPYEDGNYYQLGESAVVYGGYSDASFHILHNKETRKAAGFLSYSAAMNQWYDTIDFHPNLSILSDINSLYLHDKYGYYVFGGIINDNPAVADTGYYPMIATMPPWHGGPYGEKISAYPTPFPRQLCKAAPICLSLGYEYDVNDEGQVLYYICDELLHYNRARDEWKIIPVPQAMVDYGWDPEHNWAYDMIQPTADEVWFCGYEGIFVCNLDALLASAKPTPIEDIEWVLPKLGFRNVYPNPSTNRTVTAEIMCYYKNLSTIEIGLYNQIGQKLLDLSKNYSHNSTEHSINLTFTVPQNIPSGMYYLTVHNGDEYKAQPIVITDY